jgi:hypothetical protein
MHIPFAATVTRLGSPSFAGALVFAIASHATAAPVFTPGNLVVSLVGNVDGSGPYTDNQATPIKLQELTTSGVLGNSLLLPQTTSVVNGRTEYAVSGEYGSSSEGLLHRSADGLSLVIAGYGVNAATYNSGGAAVYGDARLAQSTSIQGGTYTAVSRVIADISIGGNVDSSTGLYGVFNQNNPRSVATVNGSSFYIAGQGASKSDTATQGVFYAQDGASSGTQISNVSDYRSVSIQGGTLYASRDYNPPSGSTAPKDTEVDRFATALPTSASAPTAVVGGANAAGEITVTTGKSDNGANSARAGSLVYLSPEDYFFASSTIMYVADSGIPKNGSANAAGLGDGGLQKWQLVNGTWMLLYDIYAGLGLVNNANASGTTGLIGLTGQVINGVTYLYATNATIGDLDQTYVFSVFDPLAQTVRGAASGSDSFTTLFTAPAGTNVRGIAFAPVPEPETIMLTMIGLMGLLVSRRRTARASRA